MKRYERPGSRPGVPCIHGAARGRTAAFGGYADIASEVRRALVGDDVSSEEDEILEFYPE